MKLGQFTLCDSFCRYKFAEMVTGSGDPVNVHEIRLILMISSRLNLPLILMIPLPHSTYLS